MSIRLGLGLGLQYSCRGRCGGSQESATIEAYDSNENLIDPVVHEDGTKFWVFTDDSGTLKVDGSPTVDILLVGGGGGGGGGGGFAGYSGGGGGGGRAVEVVGVTLDNEAYTIARGGGGAEATNGGSSSLYEGMGDDKVLLYRANGGGGGGIFPIQLSNQAKNGGSGGGGIGKGSVNEDPHPGGLAVPPSTEPHGYGNDGGTGAHNRAGGGGGGAGGPGQDSISDGGLGGPGGAGKTFPRFAGVIEGNPDGLFAGGGRGGTRSSSVPPDGEGTHGYGGGGNYSTAPTSGKPGGNGIVIIRMGGAK